MNSIKQYRPTFIDGFKNEVVEFSTDKELTSIPFVKNFQRGNFSHYAISGNYLMAIYDDGFEWWVVGVIKDPGSVDLPKWDGGKYRALLDGEVVVLDKEVYSTCDDTIKLKDGRRATWLRRGHLV